MPSTGEFLQIQVLILIFKKLVDCCFTSLGAGRPQITLQPPDFLYKTCQLFSQNQSREKKELKKIILKEAVSS